MTTYKAVKIAKYIIAVATLSSVLTWCGRWMSGMSRIDNSLSQSNPPAQPTATPAQIKPLPIKDKPNNIPAETPALNKPTQSILTQPEPTTKPAEVSKPTQSTLTQPEPTTKPAEEPAKNKSLKAPH